MGIYGHFLLIISIFSSKLESRVIAEGRGDIGGVEGEWTWQMREDRPGARACSRSASMLTGHLCPLLYVFFWPHSAAQVQTSWRVGFNLLCFLLSEYSEAKERTINE